MENKGISSKLYSHSPSLKRDGESGKIKVVKPELKEPEKETDSSSAIEKEMSDRQASERKELLEKHEKEYLDFVHKKGDNK